MKIRNLLLTTLLSSISALCGWAQTDTTPPSAGATPPTSGTGTGGHWGGHGGRMLAGLTDDERSHFLRVREQVMTSNPDLKTEQDKLMQDGKSLHSEGSGATTEDRQAFRSEMKAFRGKVDSAMLAADPSVGPILDKIKEAMKARLAQHRAAAAGGSTGGTDGQ